MNARSKLSPDADSDAKSSDLINPLRSLDQALRFARARLSPDITAQRLLILLNVYFNEGLSQRELLSTLDSTSITALSRNIADLSAFTTRKLPGPGLLEQRADPMNLRIKRVHLTTKGRRFMKSWLKAASQTPAGAGIGRTTQTASRTTSPSATRSTTRTTKRKVRRKAKSR